MPKLTIRDRLRVVELRLQDRKLSRQARRCEARSRYLLAEIQRILTQAQEREIVDVGGAKRIEAELHQLQGMVPTLTRLRNEVIRELNALTGSSFPTFPETGA